MTKEKKINKILLKLQSDIYNRISNIEDLGFSTSSAVDIVRDFLKEKF